MKNLFRFPAVAPQIISRDAGSDNDPYGLLSKLEGTWVGDKGWNMVTVPIPGSTSSTAFNVLVRPYWERMSFQKINGPVPNRGRNVRQDNYAIKYDLQVNDLETYEGMHAENGMFLNQGLTGDEEANKIRVAKQSIIPHGNSVLALGTAKSENSGYVPIREETSKFNDDFKFNAIDVELSQLPGYTEQVPLSAQKVVKKISKKFRGTFDPTQPIDSLVTDIKDKDIIQVYTIDVNTNKV